MAMLNNNDDSFCQFV